MKLRRIEAIISTAIILFVLIIIHSSETRNWEEQRSYFLADPFKAKGLPFNFYTNHLLPLLLFASLFYVAFITFNNWIIPKFIAKRRYEQALIVSILAFFFIWLGFAFCEWARKMYEHHSVWLYFNNRNRVIPAIFFTVVFLTAYTLIKQGTIFLLKQKGNLTARIVKESLIAIIVILLVFILLMSVNAHFGPFWLIMSVYAFIMYNVDLHVILPFCTKRNYNLKTYLFVRVPVSLVAYIPFGLLFVVPTSINFSGFIVAWICVNLILIPITWYMYKQQVGNLSKLLNLETALDKSTANLGFLRSQINPHFLFNVLNTLYGTALMEEAEMTASGIQKLGDMMRFMLHENIQEKILLVREIEYLQHYIDLQCMRTARSSNVLVDHRLATVGENHQIAPMLLIPFVENAFKHGISLNENSWIKINLYLEAGKLYFDVYNSIHKKASNDPEKSKSGIGLVNVQQRLAQLYQGKHELSIRQTNEEYFIHLTLVL
ncbi:sensor histidine kinase [Olivibacter sp. SDN3]|uniref:sensor histidine kinase n=1 Tax=Olivibacter sp. SDN3 TaxID=2764720 RepID=UPI001650F56D|nr:histidine kinase [Olivibacter sp. SDN3]QNL48255.1 sensor histidine kinase [Olivibacter sp. SDN3]